MKDLTFQAARPFRLQNPIRITNGPEKSFGSAIVTLALMASDIDA
jgi:hypothetical protein